VIDDELVDAVLLLRFPEGDKGDKVTISRRRFNMMLPYVREVTAADVSEPDWVPAASYRHPDDPEPELDGQVEVEVPDIWSA